MQYIPAYTGSMTMTMKKSLNDRSQKYSQQTLYYSHAFNPTDGHKLPFFVKLPKISNIFDEMARDHPWADHHLGTYNGLYYVSAKPDEKRDKFKIPPVVFGTTDFYEEFTKTVQCALLQEFTTAYDNMDIGGTMDVHLVDEGYDFSQIESLKKAGNFMQ